MAQDWKSATFIVIFPLWIVILLLFHSVIHNMIPSSNELQFEKRFTNTLSSCSFVRIVFGDYRVAFVWIYWQFVELVSCPVAKRDVRRGEWRWVRLGPITVARRLPTFVPSRCEQLGCHDIVLFLLTDLSSPYSLPKYLCLF